MSETVSNNLICFEFLDCLTILIFTEKNVLEVLGSALKNKHRDWIKYNI
jgi:hypothetical protein